MKAFTGDGREGRDDSAVLSDAVSKFNVAACVGATKVEADDVTRGNLANTGWSEGDSEACSYETQDGEPLGSFLDDPGAETLFHAGRDASLVGVGASGWGEEDKRLIPKAAGGDCSCCGKCVVGGDDGYEGFGEQGFDVEPRGGAAVAEETRVKRLVCDGLDDARGVGLVQLEMDAGEVAAICAEHGGQRGQHGGADEAHAQEADFSATDAASFVEIFLDAAEGAAGALEEDLSCAGEAYGSRGADEQGVTEDVFQLADLLREGRLGEVKSQGRAAEVELFSDGDEVAQVAEFDVAIHISKIIIRTNKILDILPGRP